MRRDDIGKRKMTPKNLKTIMQQEGNIAISNDPYTIDGISKSRAPESLDVFEKLVRGEIDILPLPLVIDIGDVFSHVNHIFNNKGIATCIGCGCDDLHACYDEKSEDACQWIRLDQDAGQGVCSVCLSNVDRWDAGDREIAVP